MLLCEHGRPAPQAEGHRAACATCGSFWDLDFYEPQDFVYDESYPEERGHFDPLIGRIKVRTLKHWLDRVDLRLEGLNVCEVGFGGGSCLRFLAEHAKHVAGIEANPGAIDEVRSWNLGIELMLATDLPPSTSEPVDLWIFQDSFEHIPDPAEFLDWLAANSSPTARILLVAPQANSVSERLLGKWWPHKLRDHRFHWSKEGLREFFERRNFVPVRDFFPVKYVSPPMAVAHVFHKLGVRRQLRVLQALAGFSVPFNFGEMGLVLERRAPDSNASTAR